MMTSFKKIGLLKIYKSSRNVSRKKYYSSLFIVWKVLAVFCILTIIPTGFCKHSQSRRDLISLMQMFSYKVRKNVMEFNNYGNYCGFLGNGIPIDEIDQCCKIHDQCYKDSAERPEVCYDFGTISFYWVPYKWTPHNGIIECDVYKQRKKLCGTSDACNGKAADPSSDVSNLTATQSALMLLRSHFPVEKFAGRLPAIVLKHQLCSIIKNKTLVDKELNDLRLNGNIRCFHLGAEADDICIVCNDDYKTHTNKIASDSAVVAKFLVTLLNNYSDLSISKESLLKDYISKEEDITELMNVGLLTVRDVGSWWHAIPRAGEFMKSYIRGRKAILLMVKKSKYSEILQQELEVRKLPKVAKLGILYHIHDIIGAELVSCITTTSGRLLRLKE